jgi:acylphosphatase
MKHYCVHITGKVQGVAFRYYSRLKAKELGLLGSTENQEDGSVLTHIQGDKESIKNFILWCNEGSPAAEVKNVDVKELSILMNQEYKDFSILR